MDERDLDLYEHTDTVNELLARYGVKFGIYKNNSTLPLCMLFAL